jgi:FkbM family methyltransferase
MLNGVKHALDRLRHRRIPSLLLRVPAKPLVALSDLVADQTRRKVKINGGTVSVDGISLRFPPDVGTIHLSQLYWHRETSDEGVWWILRALIPEAVRFADVGSYVGLYSVLAKKLNPGCEVWAFEPVPSIAAKNRRFSAANGVDIRLHEMALSDRNGKATLYLPDSETGVEESTATLQTQSWQTRRADDGSATRIEVSTSQLDTLCREQDWWPDLLKIDVEDHEAAALRGMRTLLMQKRPSVVCEILPRDHGNRETLSLVAEVGYDLHAITPSGLFRITQLPRSRTYMDCLLTPASVLPEQLSPSEIAAWAAARTPAFPR